MVHVTQKALFSGGKYLDLEKSSLNAEPGI